MLPLEWLQEGAEWAWGQVSGAAESLWHKVVHWVWGIIHGVVGWVEGFWGLIERAWGWLTEAIDFVVHEIEAFAGTVAHLFWVFVNHVIPSIWKWIAYHAKQAWHWVENAVKWAASHIARLAAEAWHWVEGAVKWVTNHVLRPLEKLASYVWNHLTQWAHEAWYLVTHPAKLADLLFWPLWYVFEHSAWSIGRKIGQWLAELVWHNTLRLIGAVEGIIADIL